VLGWISVILGVIGAILPVMPTTPFLILAAYLFSKSSPRFHRWLLNLPTFGPIIKEWEEKKTIKKKIKIQAITLLSLSMIITLSFVPVKVEVKYVLASAWVLVSLFIWTRKSE